MSKLDNELLTFVFVVVWFDWKLSKSTISLCIFVKLVCIFWILVISKSCNPSKFSNVVFIVSIWCCIDTFVFISYNVWNSKFDIEPSAIKFAFNLFEEFRIGCLLFSNPDNVEFIVDIDVLCDETVVFIFDIFVVLLATSVNKSVISVEFPETSVCKLLISVVCVDNVVFIFAIAVVFPEISIAKLTNDVFTFESISFK